MVEVENVETFYGDVLDIESLKKAVDGVDVIYHLAAVVDYLAPKDLMFKVNVLGTKNLLEASKGKKFIYLSSTAAMGKNLKEIPANENTSCHPSDYYGETKLEAEKIVKEAGGIIIRSADVYGLGFEEGYFTVFSQLEHEKMPVFGNGKNIIQYTHINDLIQALLLAKDKGKTGEVYIITGKDIKSQKELYEIVCKHLGIPFVEKHVSPSMAKFILFFKNMRKERPKFIAEYINKLAANRLFDITKAKNELGYEPKVEYENGIAEMIEEYKKSKQQEENVTEKQSKEQSQGKD
jgi:nucleoside-diphosphate-sugar epimerase